MTAGRSCRMAVIVMPQPIDSRVVDCVCLTVGFDS
jgi:hypothetical protein